MKERADRLPRPRRPEDHDRRSKRANRKERLVEMIGQDEKVWVDGNYIRKKLSVSRTKAYEIIGEIAET